MAVEVSHRTWFKRLSGENCTGGASTSNGHNKGKPLPAKPHIPDVSWIVPTSDLTLKPNASEPSHIHMRSKERLPYVRISTRVYGDFQKEPTDTEEQPSQAFTDEYVKPPYTAPHRKWFRHLMEYPKADPVREKSAAFSQVASLLCTPTISSLLLANPLGHQVATKTFLTQEHFTHPDEPFIPILRMDVKGENITLSTILRHHSKTKTVAEDFRRFQERTSGISLQENSGWQYNIVPEPIQQKRKGWLQKTATFIAEHRPMSKEERYSRTPRVDPPTLIAQRPFNPHDFTHKNAQNDNIDWEVGLTLATRSILSCIRRLNTASLEKQTQDKVASLIATLEKLQTTRT